MRVRHVLHTQIRTGFQHLKKNIGSWILTTKENVIKKGIVWDCVVSNVFYVFHFDYKYVGISFSIAQFTSQKRTFF